MTSTVFGRLQDGTLIDVYTLEEAPIRVRIMNYGAHLLSIETPDRAGRSADIVLGHDHLEPYAKPPRAHFGGVIGRYANRIAKGAFSLRGRQYLLSQNEGETTLHGGKIGFDQRVWQARAVANGVEFSMTSPHGDQGFPGTMTVRVRYTLTRQALTLDYFAACDQDTVVNLTNHCYFNLAGEGQGDILGHRLTLHADRFTPADAAQIPTGEIVSVEGTPFDFRQETAIGARIAENHEELLIAGGYDENFVLPEAGGALREAARVTEPGSGRVMTVSTTEPAIQLYTGNHLDKAQPGKNGHIYRRHTGLCLETQHYPDSPNHPSFPSTILPAGQEFRSQTVFAFSLAR